LGESESRSTYFKEKKLTNESTLLRERFKEKIEK
jgi:hypothetical protein